MYLEAVSLYLLRRQLAGQLRSAQLVRPGPADNARHGILTAAGDTGVEGAVQILSTQDTIYCRACGKQTYNASLI